MVGICPGCIWHGVYCPGVICPGYMSGGICPVDIYPRTIIYNIYVVFIRQLSFQMIESCVNFQAQSKTSYLETLTFCTSFELKCQHIFGILKFTNN